MPKSSEVELARRVNATISLLKGSASSSEVLARLISGYGLSRRQAYRYLQQARQAREPWPVPDKKTVFTVKLSAGLILQVRQQAQRERCSISSWVERGLRRWLAQAQKHG